MKKFIKDIHSFFKRIIPTFNMIVINSTIMLNVGCNTWNPIPTLFHIEQDTYLTLEDIQKVHIGLTKSHILANIGPPILQDLLGRNKFYYVYSHYNTKNKLEHRIIEFLFDSNDILIVINIL